MKSAIGRFSIRIIAIASVAALAIYPSVALTDVSRPKIAPEYVRANADPADRNAATPPYLRAPQRGPTATPQVQDSRLHCRAGSKGKTVVCLTEAIARMSERDKDKALGLASVGILILVVLVWAENHARSLWRRLRSRKDASIPP